MTSLMNEPIHLLAFCCTAVCNSGVGVYAAPEFMLAINILLLLTAVIMVWGLTFLTIAIILWRLINYWYRRGIRKDFAGKYVFVTGTDSGFGYKLALDLDKQGVNVYAGCFTKHGAIELKNEASHRLKIVEIDITNQNSVNKAKEFIEIDLPVGRSLWGLVNNAGILGNVDFALATLEDYQKVMEVNFFGQVRVIEAFFPLINQSKGRIVQVISIFGRGTVSTAPYNCSKFALEPYTDELRRFALKSGVSVITIEPGLYRSTKLIDEDLWIDVLKRKWDTLCDKKKAELGYDYLDSAIKNHWTIFKINPLGTKNRVEFVTNGIIHALGAQNPKTRYMIGYDAIPYIIITNFLPDWILDGIIRFYLWACKYHGDQKKFMGTCE